MRKCEWNTCENKDKCRVRGVCGDLLRNTWKLKPLADIELCTIYFLAKQAEMTEKTAINYAQ